MIGQTIAHYRIEARLGEGGMGEVYLAFDTKLERKVALKFLPEGLAADPDARQRLLREAKATSRLNHPNILTVHAVEESGGRDYIVMEFVKGRPLDEHVQGQNRPLPELLDLVMQIADGLSKAHQAGIVHRDIKPSNILVDADGRARILDFGLATFRGAARLTQTGSTLGTAAYMSPEQAQAQDCDHRADLFSLGVVLYEMIAGQLPFRGSHPAALTYAIVNDTPEPLARYKSDLPDEIQRIVSKCLEKRPSERYQSAADLLADLRRARRLGETSSPSLPPAASLRKMLAVLPFENLGLAEDEYFADGITEEIISRLATVKDLGVISRTSVMQYKGTRKSMRDIGAELGADHILEGTVRWGKASGGSSRVRITPQLIKVADDTHLWSDRYDRVLEDIFDVQSEIAEQVVSQLNVKLADPEKRAIEAKPTQNMDAYHAYLRGVDYFNRPDYGLDNHSLAIQMFERAVQLDPGFAQAWAYLSISHSGMHFYGFDRSPERMSRSKAAVDRALALNSVMPEARLALGFFHYRFLAEHARALEEFEEAARLLPSDPRPRFLVAMIKRRQGHFREALEGAMQALALDPMRPGILLEVGITAMVMRRFDEAERLFDRSISVAPDQDSAYAWKALLRYLGRGDLAGARSALQAMGDRGLDDSYWEYWELLLAERDLEAALRHVQRLKTAVYEDQMWYFPKPLIVAETHTLLGNPADVTSLYEEAIRVLEPVMASDPKDPRLRVAMATACAGLGRGQEAIAHAMEAARLCPTSKDALAGPMFSLSEAVTRARVGDQDTALHLLEHLLSIPSFLAPGHLRVAPHFDPLRGHPEFDRLVNLPVVSF